MLQTRFRRRRIHTEDLRKLRKSQLYTGQSIRRLKSERKAFLENGFSDVLKAAVKTNQVRENRKIRRWICMFNLKIYKWGPWRDGGQSQFIIFWPFFFACRPRVWPICQLRSAEVSVRNGTAGSSRCFQQSLLSVSGDCGEHSAIPSQSFLFSTFQHALHKRLIFPSLWYQPLCEQFTLWT